MSGILSYKLLTSIMWSSALRWISLLDDSNRNPNLYLQCSEFKDSNETASDLQVQRAFSRLLIGQLKLGYN